MNVYTAVFLGILVLWFFQSPQQQKSNTANQKQKQVDENHEIRLLLIDNSLKQYSGSCPCPYYFDRAGNKCGGRSAYSRPGGASPLCYTSDITDLMVEQYKKKMNL